MLWASHSLAQPHNNGPPVSIHVVSKQNNVPHTQTIPLRTNPLVMGLDSTDFNVLCLFFYCKKQLERYLVQTQFKLICDLLVLKNFIFVFCFLLLSLPLFSLPPPSIDYGIGSRDLL